MKFPVSMQFADGVAQVVDMHGFVYTATGVAAEPGDVFGVEWRADGWWFTVEHAGETARYPLRHGNDPHPTELTVMMLPPNPIFPPAS